MKHIHGGDPKYYFAKFGLPERRVLDFSVNINPLGPPPIIKEIWDELFLKIHLYPSIYGNGVKEFYKKKFGVPEEFVLPGNGSTELIYLIIRTIPAKVVAVVKPSYFDYERACILAGKQVISIYTDPDSLMRDAEAQLLRDIENSLFRADAIWIGRPNNPTGSVIPKEMIFSIAKKFSDKWIILDEAFIQFLDCWKEQTFISPDIPRNILVLHSLTKFYAIPGIRVGALISRPENIKLVFSKKEPWTVNVLAEEISKRLGSVDEYENRTLALVSKERQRLYNAIINSEYIIPVPSKTNFILCKYKDELDRLLKYLLENGIYVRDCRNFDGLKGNFFRIGIRMPEENDLLISKLLSA